MSGREARPLTPTQEYGKLCVEDRGSIVRGWAQVGPLAGILSGFMCVLGLSWSFVCDISALLDCARFVESERFLTDNILCCALSSPCGMSLAVPCLPQLQCSVVS